jgi:cytochrome c oxidase subunit 1
MLFWFVMPFAMGSLGNFLVPSFLSCSDMSFPRLNTFSWFSLLGSVFFLSFSYFLGGIYSGWTLYPPLSVLSSSSSSSGFECLVLSVHLVGGSSVFGSCNFVATFHQERSFSDSEYSYDLFIWSVVITSFLLLSAIPILGAAVTLLLLDKNFSTFFFDVSFGGDPVLFEHLFWIFGHPEVYIVIIPIFGIVSVILGDLCRKSIYGHVQMVYAMLVIGFVGYVVWMHHMFTVGLEFNTRLYFSAATLVIAIPTSVKVYSWLLTIWKSNVCFSVSFCFAVGFVVCFTFGGFSGALLANSLNDLYFHDTYFVVGHFHMVLSLGAVYGVFCAFYHFITLWSSFSFSEFFGYSHFHLFFWGTIFLFGPMHFYGLYHLPRRVIDFSDYVWVDSFLYYCTVFQSIGLIGVILSFAFIKSFCFFGLYFRY